MFYTIFNDTKKKKLFSKFITHFIIHTSSILLINKIESYSIALALQSSWLHKNHYDIVKKLIIHIERKVDRVINYILRHILVRSRQLSMKINTTTTHKRAAIKHLRYIDGEKNYYNSTSSTISSKPISSSSSR